MDNLRQNGIMKRPWVLEAYWPGVKAQHCYLLTSNKSLNFSESQIIPLLNEIMYIASKAFC